MSDQDPCKCGHAMSFHRHDDDLLQMECGANPDCGHFSCRFPWTPTDFAPRPACDCKNWRALVEPVPAPTGIDPSELMRALHANLTPLAHVEVTDRRPYGMSEDTIQVWPITGVRSVVNHLALKSAPVPAPRLKCDHTTEFYDEAGDSTRVLWSEDVIGYNYCPDCGTLLSAPPVGTQPKGD
jgi:hypothetical protein